MDPGNGRISATTMVILDARNHKHDVVAMVVHYSARHSQKISRFLNIPIILSDVS